MNPINWEHIVVEGMIYLVPTLGALYLGYRKLMWMLGEYRPHRHGEKEGYLSAEGITYPRHFNGHD